jgi:hypothetical protein
MIVIRFTKFVTWAKKSKEISNISSKKQDQRRASEWFQNSKKPNWSLKNMKFVNILYDTIQVGCGKNLSEFS